MSTNRSKQLVFKLCFVKTHVTIKYQVNSTLNYQDLHNVSPPKVWGDCSPKNFSWGDKHFGENLWGGGGEFYKRIFQYSECKSENFPKPL